MPVAHVASSSGSASTTATSGNMTGVLVSGASSSKTFTYTPTGSGNLVIFAVSMSPSATGPTTCSAAATGWVFTQLGGITAKPSGSYFTAFWAITPNTSATTITITWNQPIGTFTFDLLDEFSGTDTSTPINTNNAAAGTGTPTVSVTPTISSAMIWAAASASVTAVGTIGGATANKGADDANQDWSEYLHISGGSGVAQDCTFTSAGAYALAAAVLNEVLVGPTIGSVPSGDALVVPAFSAYYLFFDTGDFGSGV